MQLQVCRPYVYSRDNPALVRWNLSNKLTYAEAFRQQQVRDERIERTASMRGMDSNVLKFVESRSRSGDKTPLGVLREGLMEVVFEMGGRLYVVYPRFLSMRDVEFIYRTSERIVVAAVRESGDTLEQMMQKAREETGIMNGDIAEHAEFIRALGEARRANRQPARPRGNRG